MLPPSAILAKRKMPTNELVGSSDHTEDEPVKKHHKQQKGLAAPAQKSTRNASLAPTDH